MNRRAAARGPRGPEATADRFTGDGSPVRRNPSAAAPAASADGTSLAESWPPRYIAGNFSQRSILPVWSIVQAAGWPIWPLILCSVLALAFIVERFISLKPARVLSAGLVDEAIEVSRNAVPTPDTVNQLEQHSALGAVLAAGWRAINTNPRCTAADMRAAIEADSFAGFQQEFHAQRARGA